MALALDIQNLNKTYSNGVNALHDVSLTIQEGDFFALLGPNGAGKSTLIGVLTSLVIKSSGTVKIFDIDIDQDFSKAKEYVGVVPQEFNFNMFEKVEDIIINQAGYYGISHAKIKDRLDFLLDILSLKEKRKTTARQLSGGMKRRLMIARALIHSPRLLILDEPTAGVDIELRRSMWDFIKYINKEEKTTIILTTHYLEEAEQLAKNIAIIDKGEVLVNTNIKDFLKTSSSQAYILDFEDSIEEDFTIPNLKSTVIDDKTIEVVLSKDESINILFDKIGKTYTINSIKPKEHKLEKLFNHIVRENK